MRSRRSFSQSLIDGSVVSYFSDHFTRQLMAGIMATDYLGLCPKPNKRIEGGGATGGLCFQSAWESVASGRMNCCVAFGFETMSRVQTWKGNEFIAHASDTNFDYPVGGFYSGYYAMMVNRHIHEFGTTVVLIEHDMGVVMDISDRVVVLDYGKKIGDGTPDEVRNNPEVISAYLGTGH